MEELTDMNNKLFLKLQNSNIVLFYDLILFEAKYPVLFTCLDQNNILYLVSCYTVDAEKRAWIIVETTEETVIKLLENQIQIYSAFTRNDYVYQVIKFIENEPVVTKKFFFEIDIKILPTVGYYMDSDKHEFDDEIAILKVRSLLKETKS